MRIEQSAPEAEPSALCPLPVVLASTAHGVAGPGRAAIPDPSVGEARHGTVPESLAFCAGRRVPVGLGMVKSRSPPPVLLMSARPYPPRRPSGRSVSAAPIPQQPDS